MTPGPQDIGSEKDRAPRSPEVDFAVVLSRVITSIEDDPAQLRNSVYELARIKLRREAWQNPPINLGEARRLTLALESAIERVETIYSKHDKQRALQSLDRLIESSEIDTREVLIEPREPLLMVNRAPAQTADDDHLPVFLTPAKGMSLNVERSSHLPGAAPLLRGAMVAIFAVVLCVGLSRFGLRGSQAPQPAASTVEKNATAEPKPVVQTPEQALQSPATALPQSSPFPLPTVYGVYAVSGGQLHELEALPVGRVPDQRVFMSTAIRTPSRTVLPDGKTVFVVYRRDVASSAPERVTVRVIAKIIRAMTFSTAGQASMEDVGDTWTIRNVSYEFRVAPLSKSSEMLMIRPENVDFVFPAGRYGLVIKGQAYDFTVAGLITEAAQCLEGVQASNGTFYSECRNP